MKGIQELYDEVMASNELKNEYLKAHKEGKIGAFLIAHDCSASVDDLKAFLKDKKAEVKTGELSDDELDDVSGGTCRTEDGRFIPPEGFICDNYHCKKCGGLNTEIVENPVCPGCGISAVCQNCIYGTYENGIWICNVKLN